MGTRIEVYLTHDLPRFDDVGAVLARLEGTMPAALAVRAFWRAEGSGAFDEERWEAEAAGAFLPNVRRYRGPGSLYLTMTRAAACIGTGGRWRGFLGIEPLRRVHLSAFRAIADALGSPELAICADSQDDV